MYVCVCVSGDISVHKLIVGIPFENMPGKVKIKGSDIKEALEKSVYRYDGNTPRGEFLQVSG